MSTPSLADVHCCEGFPLNDGNATDVDRALAAIGSAPIRYRNFGNHNLRPSAAYVATPALLDDTVYDPFAPQAVVHSMSETQPDVLLPAGPPTADSPMFSPPELTEPAPPVPARVSPKPQPVRVAVEAALSRDVTSANAKVVATSAPDVVEMVRAMPSLRLVVMPAIAPHFVARATGAPVVAAQPAATSLPSLGTRIAAREAAHDEVSVAGARPLSIRDMFKFLNERSGAGRSLQSGFGKQ